MPPSSPSLGLIAVPTGTSVLQITFRAAAPRGLAGDFAVDGFTITQETMQLAADVPITEPADGAA